MDPSEYLQRIATVLRLTRQKLRLTLEKRKLAMDNGAKHQVYEIGNFVYLLHPDTGTPSHTSLQPVYIGPFEVL